MISSGLQIIYTQDEVAFVQNLVYYVERAYRTPDYGMWERGSRYNDGTPEIHASSIGMAKSALEAINGCNLFGEKGASWSVIYVDIDAHNRNRSIFETMLPRESSSKVFKILYNQFFTMLKLVAQIWQLPGIKICFRGFRNKFFLLFRLISFINMSKITIIEKI